MVAIHGWKKGRFLFGRFGFLDGEIAPNGRVVNDRG